MRIIFTLDLLGSLDCTLRTVWWYGARIWSPRPGSIGRLYLRARLCEYMGNVKAQPLNLMLQ